MRVAGWWNRIPPGITACRHCQEASRHGRNRYRFPVGPVHFRSPPCRAPRFPKSIPANARGVSVEAEIDGNKIACALPSAGRPAILRPDPRPSADQQPSPREQEVLGLAQWLRGCLLWARSAPTGYGPAYDHNAPASSPVPHRPRLERPRDDYHGNGCSLAGGDGGRRLPATKTRVRVAGRSARPQAAGWPRALGRPRNHRTVVSRHQLASGYNQMPREAELVLQRA